MTIYFLDTETTRLSPVLASDQRTVEVPVEVLECAWYALQFTSNSKNFFQVTAKGSSFYKPYHDTTLAALSVHCIDTTKFKEDTPPSYQACCPKDATVLIGHNIAFDAAVLRVDPSIQLIDTQSIAQMLLPDLQLENNYSQGVVALALASDPTVVRNVVKDRSTLIEMLKNAHSATTDVTIGYIMLRQLLRKALLLGHKIETLQDVIQLYKKSSTLTRDDDCNFGKNKGIAFKKIDNGYIQWLRKEHTKNAWEFLVKRTDPVVALIEEECIRRAINSTPAPDIYYPPGVYGEPIESIASVETDDSNIENEVDDDLPEDIHEIAFNDSKIAGCH